MTGAEVGVLVVHVLPSTIGGKGSVIFAGASTWFEFAPVRVVGRATGAPHPRSCENILTSNGQEMHLFQAKVITSATLTFLCDICNVNVGPSFGLAGDERVLEVVFDAKHLRINALKRAKVLATSIQQFHNREVVASIIKCGPFCRTSGFLGLLQSTCCNCNHVHKNEQQWQLLKHLSVDCEILSKALNEVLRDVMKSSNLTICCAK